MAQSIVRSSNQEPAAPGLAGFEGGSDSGVLEAAVEALNRMRYFHDLLEQGYRHAQQPGEDPDTLRTLRVSLGISLPELDLVPLWSRRAQDGTISIPFIDFLLDQFLESLERFRGDLREAPRARAMLRENPTSSGTNQWARAGHPAPTSLPILEDRFLSEAMLARLCGPRGVLDRILRRCENSISEGGAASARICGA
ncbi:MAG: hypothetical protein L0191_07510 [Acidobacteria bacterium]|nr:hypothetical protein [Acidobacteriota bacterium]MCI0567050.1 hypothetical protein [Acidobacteriota bacterium]